MLIKAEIVRAPLPGLFAVTLWLQEGSSVITRRFTGPLEACRMFVKEECNND
jgi:hypothetical protein